MGRPSLALEKEPPQFAVVRAMVAGHRRAMTILFAASEMDPLARTGGLGDVIESLPAALAARGHDVSVVLPCYRGLAETSTSTGVKMTVQVGDKQLEAEILERTIENGVQVFLIRQDEYFDRAGIYGENGEAYPDNAERYIYFSRAVLELARRILPPPEIIHVHDWQTALLPVLIKDRRFPFKTVLTVHNLAYQGSFWAYDFGLTRLPGHYFSAQGVEFYGNVNLLKGGLLYADAITTVSERYAREINTQEFGCGLESVIREQSYKLSGILNGADYAIWNPETDPLLPARYAPDDLSGKRTCRDALLKEMGLTPNPTGPVFGMVTRLAAQKGIDLLLPVLDRLLADDVRLVILGEGNTAYERELLLASKQHPERFAYRKSLDPKLAHLIAAGSDISLIPSFYEPCGLTAMYGLKYGSVPLARATGGLFEIIQDFEPGRDQGNGFLFFEASGEALWDAIVRAKRHFQNTDEWSALRRKAMGVDLSWDRAVVKYEALYERLLRKR